MIVQDLIKGLFGGTAHELENHLIAEVNIADAVAMQYNPARAWFSVTNNSLATMYLHAKRPAAADAGYVLQPSTTISFNVFTDFHLTTLEWHMAATANNSDVTILELVLD